MSAGYPTGDALQRALHTLRWEGPRSFLFRLLSASCYRRVVLLARDLGEALPTTAAKVDIALCELGRDDLETYLAFRRDATRASIARRFACGHRCFVARRDGEIVSACWAAERDAWSEYLGCAIALVSGEVYFYDAYTGGAARGLALAPAICAHQLATYRAAGLARAVRATMPENRPALVAHAKSGFAPYALVGRIGIGSWQHRFRRTLGS